MCGKYSKYYSFFPVLTGRLTKIFIELNCFHQIFHKKLHLFSSQNIDQLKFISKCLLKSKRLSNSKVPK